jgi:hypothetical protein
MLELRSEPGKGTTAVLVLPVAPRGGARGRHGLAAQALGHGVRP